jgi:predicted outer membrane protein
MGFFAAQFDFFAMQARFSAAEIALLPAPTCRCDTRIAFLAIWTDACAPQAGAKPAQAEFFETEAAKNALKVSR